MRIYQYGHLVGNSVTVSLLRRAVNNNKLKNLVIMSGVMGTGKSSSAEITGLILTCENPTGGEPCLECSSCKTNLRALRENGTSMNLSKKNLGKLNTRKDVNDLIQEIFVLQGSYGENVYILEEFHALKKDDQTPFLEEFDRLGERTKVIITTTRPHLLLPELRSRAAGATYTFNRLKRTESKMLFDRTVNRLGIKTVDRAVEAMIIKHARGIPRDLVSLIEFTRDAQPTVEEMREHLGFISNAIFIDLFSTMKFDLKNTVDVLDGLLSQNSLETVIYQLKEFMVNVIYLLAGGIRDDFNPDEVKELKSSGLASLTLI
jgi:DNA polymerase-3 subunit gamma/tau